MSACLHYLLPYSSDGSENPKAGLLYYVFCAFCFSNNVLFVFNRTKLMKFNCQWFGGGCGTVYFLSFFGPHWVMWYQVSHVQCKHYLLCCWSSPSIDIVYYFSKFWILDGIWTFRMFNSKLHFVKSVKRKNNCRIWTVKPPIVPLPWYSLLGLSFHSASVLLSIFVKIECFYVK